MIRAIRARCFGLQDGVTAMSQPAKAQEPSMEEILASIRRIIADDDAGKPAKAPELAPPPAAVTPERPAPRPVAPPPRPMPPAAEGKTPAPADVLDLTEAMAAPPPPANFRTIDGEPDVIFSDRAAETPAPSPEPAMRVVEEARKQFTQNAPDRSLLSMTTTAAVDSAFNSLAHTVLGNNARTLEDLVKEMLRPMLKGWLDDNLPGLVERIVRAEIERVSRGRG
jgi:cell pole-organizing protein PopZ